MGLVDILRIKLIDPILICLAYIFAMLLYYIIAWNPDLLKNADIETITLLEKATKRNYDVSDYFNKIAKMRGLEDE